MTSNLTPDEIHDSISEDTIERIHSWLDWTSQGEQQLLEECRDTAIDEAYEFGGCPFDVADYIQASVRKSNKELYRYTQVDDVELDYDDDTLYIAGDSCGVGVTVQLTLQQIMKLAVDADLHNVVIYDDLA